MHLALISVHVLVSSGGYSSGAASSQPMYAKQGMRPLIVTALRSLVGCFTILSVSAVVISSVHSTELCSQQTNWFNIKLCTS
jgi:hypothetical protein